MKIGRKVTVALIALALLLAGCTSNNVDSVAEPVGNNEENKEVITLTYARGADTTVQ